MLSFDHESGRFLQQIPERLISLLNSKVLYLCSEIYIKFQIFRPIVLKLIISSLAYPLLLTIVWGIRTAI